MYHYTLKGIQRGLASGRLARGNALALCLEHWNAIAEAIATGTYHCRTKREIWEALTGLQGCYTASSQCACCAYDQINERSYCGRSCLLRWSGGSCNNGEFSHFFMDESKEKALAIAYLAETALDELEEGEPSAR